MRSHVIFIAAGCHSMNLCVLAAQAIGLQQNDAVTRMCRPCQVQSS